MIGLHYNVPQPVAVRSLWKYVDDSNRMDLPADIDLSAIGATHVYFAQLAVLLGRTSDILSVSRNPLER